MFDDLVMEPQTQQLLLEAIDGYIADIQRVQAETEIMPVEDDNLLNDLLVKLSEGRKQLAYVEGKSKEATRRISKRMRLEQASPRWQNGQSDSPGTAI